MTDAPGLQRDAEGPNIARVYDYLLGGSHNFVADRAFAQEFLASWPDARQTMRLNRAFLGRAVRYLAGSVGIGQFLDIGSGIPTMGNVHEIAQRADPDARVVYVDSDEVAVVHSQAILARNKDAIAVKADLRRPGEILGHPDCGTCWTFPSPSRCCWWRFCTSFPIRPPPPRWSPNCGTHWHPGATW